MAARILVIEDDPAYRELIRYLLARAGHEVLLAVDGRAGLACAQVNSPNLVLTDLGLPGLDGMMLSAQLRQRAGWKSVPVIAVTGSSREEDRAAALQAGFDGFISKPIRPDTFVGQVEAFLTV